MLLSSENLTSCSSLMHGGRAGDPVVGAGKGVKTIGCDREHEEHEALVEHFQVHTFVIWL